MTVRKISPSLFQMLGIYLPLITTNCAVLGVALLLVEGMMGFLKACCSPWPLPWATAW